MTPTATSEECVHALEDVDGAHPVTRYILSPEYAGWRAEAVAEHDGADLHQS